MKPFDCLSPECPIFGAHLLEASAGTGKTFAIEQVLVRLLLESDAMETHPNNLKGGLGIEQILAVTFTRASVRDLKKRIAANLHETLQHLKEHNESRPYLRPFLGSEAAMRKISEALRCVDQFQIFTIHGFCHRMLQEFAFEARVKIHVADPDKPERIPKRLLQRAMYFLETEADERCLVPEQIGLLLKQYDSLEVFARRLIKKDQLEHRGSFTELVQRCQDAFASENIEIPLESTLCETFDAISSGFKSKVKGNFKAQIKALASIQSTPASSLRLLLKEKGSLFDFLSPENQKLRTTVSIPEFFLQAKTVLKPLLDEGLCKKKILGWLQNSWSPIEAGLLAAQPLFDPDEILHQTYLALQQEGFLHKVRQKYRAVFIDEFQDTDPLQWKIFKMLFVDQPIDALYLVGDPKQSIYRFRKADVYTYFEARDALGPHSLFCLDTNYRSSPKIINVLNALFARPWLKLPRTTQVIPSPAIKAGALHCFEGKDGKGAVHCWIGHSLEDAFLPFAVQEIEKLAPLFPSFSSFAILVKDRYEAQSALALLQQRGIPAIAKSQDPLNKTFAFRSLFEFLQALAFPQKPLFARIVEEGPFRATCRRNALNLLEKESLALFFRFLCESIEPSPFLQDLRQVIEEILSWEMKNGFSFPALLQFMEDFSKLDPEEGGTRRLDNEGDAVQILTLHVSKGLEFDVVFALGLFSAPHRNKEKGIEEENEEQEAERLRQLYVAMTRAKLRLYVPFPPQIDLEKEKDGSPIELFARILHLQEKDCFSFLQQLATTRDLTLEALPEKVVLEPPALKNTPPPKPLLKALQNHPRSFSPSYLKSFTSIAQHRKTEKKEWTATPLPPGYTPHSIPKGADTGVLIHKIFETLFMEKEARWKDDLFVAAHVEKHLRGTSLELWIPAVQQMMQKTLHLPLLPHAQWTLSDLTPQNLLVEVEFLFFQNPDFVKGFIDLIFAMEGKLYIVDWKTNWLGADDQAYASVEQAMLDYNYKDQSDLYTDALRRYVKPFYKQPFEEIFGGSIYIFLRGGGIWRSIPDIRI